MIVLGVLAFAVVILTIPIGRAPIWEPNNARWMLLARDMVERGHRLVPEIRGAPNEGLYKPQLFEWAIAVASLPPGHVTELTAVLPSLVSAIIGVAGVFAIGRQLWNVQAGALAALILTTTSNYFVFAQQSLADVMMTASMVWALDFLLRARDGSSFGSLLGFYACIGMAMLCKGPPGLSALAAAAVATGVEGGRFGAEKVAAGRRGARARIDRGMRLPRIGALLAALAVIVSLTASHVPAVRAESAWVLWEHAYEVFVDGNKNQQRRTVSWKRVTVMAARTDCDDRRMREARAEFDLLTGKGIGATLTGSEVGFDQRNTRFKRGYRSFECWPDTVDPKRAKGK